MRRSALPSVSGTKRVDRHKKHQGWHKTARGVRVCSTGARPANNLKHQDMPHPSQVWRQAYARASGRWLPGWQAGPVLACPVDEVAVEAARAVGADPCFLMS